MEHVSEGPFLSYCSVVREELFPGQSNKSEGTLTFRPGSHQPGVRAASPGHLPSRAQVRSQAAHVKAEVLLKVNKRQLHTKEGRAPEGLRPH